MYMSPAQPKLQLFLIRWVRSLAFAAAEPLYPGGSDHGRNNLINHARVPSWVTNITTIGNPRSYPPQVKHEAHAPTEA